MGARRANGRQCRGNASHQDTKSGELGWGPGLRPAGWASRPPSAGGVYSAKSPPVVLLTPDSLRPREPRQLPDNQRCPGDRIG